MDTPLEHIHADPAVAIAAGDYTLAAQQESKKIIRAGDAIVFNNSNTEYRINDISLSNQGTYDDPVLGNRPADNGERMLIALERSDFLPPLSVANAVIPTLTYKVVRRPRKLRSSEFELPAGYQIDLRFSGVGNQVFSPIDASGVGGNVSNIEILYDKRGAIDRVDFDGAAGTGTSGRFKYLLLGGQRRNCRRASTRLPIPIHWPKTGICGWCINTMTGSVNVGNNGNAVSVPDPTRCCGPTKSNNSQRFSRS